MGPSCGCPLCKTRNRFLLPGETQRILTRTPVGNRLYDLQQARSFEADLKKRKQRVKQQVVRTVPSPGDKDNDDMYPNQLHDNDLGEAMMAGLYAKKIVEVDGARVAVSSLNREIRRKLVRRVALVKRFAGPGYP
jgi:hypothetical protein